MAKRPLRTTRKVTNLQGQPGWYRIIRNAAGAAQVNIYDEIGFLGVSADGFMRDLASIPGDIELHLNSPGGDVFDGIAIYNQLKQRPGNVAVVVDGLAASAASFIAQAASPGCLAMAPHSQMMIHDGFGMSIGNAADMREMADLLDKASDNIAGIYGDRTGKPAAYWRQKMQDETWLDDHEAVAEGLADHVLGQEGPKNAWDLSVYLHPRNADGDPPAEGSGEDGGQPCKTCDGKGRLPHPATGKNGAKCPACDGTGTYDPDHDGDDDSSASGDTDHDYVMPDGSPGPKAQLRNADKYKQADRDRMAGKEAMDDGSYPVADEEDLDNAIRAVGRGGADHDAIRAHIIKRAAALKLESKIPDNWNADGSLKDLSETEFLAFVARELNQLDAGRE